MQREVHQIYNKIMKQPLAILRKPLIKRVFINLFICVSSIHTSIVFIIKFFFYRKILKAMLDWVLMYFKGMGVEKVNYYSNNSIINLLKRCKCSVFKQDYRRALELFQRASDRGSQEANLYIGLANLCMLIIYDTTFIT